MPLSEHEQRLLDEIEHALYAEDPKFAASVRSARRHHFRTRRPLLLCVLGVIAGLALILVGLLKPSSLIALSVVGFVLVVGSAAYGVTTLRGRTDRSTDRRRPAGSNLRPIRPSGLRGRMEERLRRRFDEN
jgi:hypothetical protein